MESSESTTPQPSAPPSAECSVGQLSLLAPDELNPFESPSSIVELVLSATNIPCRDPISKSDPVCILYTKDKSTCWHWQELDRTECVKSNLNPAWAKKFILQYKFEERQLLRFMIYDLGKSSSQSLERHNFLGKIECALGEIVSSPNSKFSRALALPEIYQDLKSPPPTLTIVAEELGDCRKVLCMKVQFNTCLKFTVFGSTTPSLAISKQLDDGSWVLLHRTDRFDLPFSLRVASLTSGGNLERALKWQLFHKKQNSKWADAKLIGEFQTNYLQLTEHYSMRKGPIKLLNPIKKQRRRSSLVGLTRRPSDGGGENDSTGTMEILTLNVENQSTFLDHIGKGLKLSITFAIDFTASNGDPARHTSLHYRHGGMDNPYVMAIKTVGEVINDYSTNKRYQAFGFGAKGFPSNRVSHNFPINFKQTDPYCDGIEGVLSSYYRVIKRIKLFGPTHFAPVIQEQCRIARESLETNTYHVLLILTDGILCDPVGTRDAIVKASDLPISIIIIGVGDEDFKEMEKLDCDGSFLRNSDNILASRDIVQFVELKKFVNFKSINPIDERNKAALAQAVLAELPCQVTSWMSMFAK